MTNLISGKEALIALANGEDVEFKRHASDSVWLKAKELKASEILNHCVMLGGDSYSIEFRLKPRTITINGIEVPAPFEPKMDEKYYHISLQSALGYGWDEWEGGSKYDERVSMFGAWRSEDEIKQVVAALKTIFKTN